MDDRSQDGGSWQQQDDLRAEPVKSRWSPKPEQLRILETIFNSGMVNPPKEETIRIRKHLEKFGSVRDANVFYWFQNRRSRSRRRQRQIEASLDRADAQEGVRLINTYDNFVPTSLSYSMNTGGPVAGSTSSLGPVENDHAHYSGEFLSFLGQSSLQVQQFEQNPLFCTAEATNFSYQHGTEMIMVFINGVATEVGRGGLDIKGMFGEGDFMMFHSSGVPVETNEYGFLVQGLQHGENYFLVPRLS